MTDITLESFLARIGRLDRSLQQLDKTLPEFSYDVLSEEETELEFQPEHWNQAEKTAESFKWLFSFENELRQQLREIADDKYGKDWFEELSFDTNAKQTILHRIKNEHDSLSSSRIDSDQLDFCTLPELGQIIQKNWDLFEDSYPRGERFFANIIRDINKYRIIIAHFSELTNSDKTNLKESLILFYNPLGRT